MSKSAISPDKWLSYFKPLLNPEVNETCEFSSIVSDFIESHTCEHCDHFPFTDELLSSVITDKEITDAITDLKQGKSSGEDGIPSSFFKISQPYLTPYLNILFNKIFDTGIFPSKWDIGMIIPLYKSGDADVKSKYRGISLLNTTGKLFNMILERRLRLWMELNELISEAQAGFRQDYSTTDNIFTLQGLATKYLCKPKGRFYAAFIDFKKAFDYVDRKHYFMHFFKKVVMVKCILLSKACLAL